MGSMVGVNGELQKCLCQGRPSRLVPPSLWWVAADPSSTEDPPTLAVLVQFPVESLLLSSESLCLQGFVYALQDWGLCLPQSYGSLLIKSHWPSRSNSLGIPSLFVGSQDWEAWHGVQNLHKSGRTSLVLLFISLWVTHPRFDFSMIVPLLPSCCGFFFVLGHEASFFGRFQYPPVDGCSTANWDFGALTEGGECTFFYSAILNWQPKQQVFNVNATGLHWKIMPSRTFITREKSTPNFKASRDRLTLFLGTNAASELSLKPVLT